MTGYNAKEQLSARVQKFDWLKDMTPEEEALMRTREWDYEGTALGPIEHRYKQPALRTIEEEHEKTMAEARTALRHADKYTEGDEVRPALFPAPKSLVSSHVRLLPRSGRVRSSALRVGVAGPHSSLALARPRLAERLAGVRRKMPAAVCEPVRPREPEWAQASCTQHHQVYFLFLIKALRRTAWATAALTHNVHTTATAK